MRIIKNRSFKPLAAIFAAFIATMNPAFCQSGPPPPPPFPDHAAAFYPLETPPWAEWFGSPAKGFTNVNVAPSWDYDGTALSVDTNCVAFVQEDVFLDRHTNMTFGAGSISLWFQPNWTSTSDGGIGPTNWAALLSVGNWTSNAAESAWAIAISPSGTNLVMEAQSAGSNQVVFNVPIDFDAGDWHSIVITYSLTNCCVYMEGQLATNTGPIEYQPTYDDCLNFGLFVGNLSTSGDYQCHGQLQWLATYDNPLSADAVASDYADISAYITYWGGRLPSGGFSLAEGPPGFPGGGSGSGGGFAEVTNSVQTPGTNLWLFISLQSNSAIITLSNTVAGSNYLLLAANSLTGPWFTNQSLLAHTNTAVALPIPLWSDNAVFFEAVRAEAGTLTGTLKWKVLLGGSGDNLVKTGIDASPAIGADGTIYIPTTGNLLYAVDPLTGNVKWTNNIFITNSSSPQAAEITGSAALGTNGTIYVGSDDGNLYSFDPSGTTNWVRNMGSYAAVYSTPAIGSNGTLYVATDETEESMRDYLIAGLLAINPNGTTNWFFSPQDPFNYNPGDIDGSPAVSSDGTIYFLAEGNRLYAVSPDGNIKWFLPVPGHTEPDSSPAIGPDGTIYVGSSSAYLYAVHSDGSLKWVFDVDVGYPSGEQIMSSPTIGPDGVIYVGTGDLNESDIFNNSGNVYAINPDGSTNWVFTGPTQSTSSSPAIAADGTVYIGCEDSYLYAVTNGSPAWAFQTGGPIISSPAIGTDGTVYVGSGDGYLYAIFGSTSPATNAAWPMFHQNPSHTALQSPPTTPAEDCGAPFVYGGDLATDGSSFSFNILATNAGTWNVFASSNLTNWTQIGSVTNVGDGSGDGIFSGTFTTNFESAVTNQFYILSSGDCLSNSCRSLVIGFVNMTVVPGTNLVADKLYQVDDNLPFIPMNTLNALFNWDYKQVPTQIFKWNGRSFDGDSFGGFAYPGWVNGGDMTVVPGSSVLVSNGTGSSFAASFVGLLREQQVFQIQTNTNYLSATLPVAGAVTNVTGYVPYNGDIIRLWNNNSQSFTNYDYISNRWSGGVPTVGVGEGFVLITTNAYTWTNTWQQNFPGCP